MKDDLHDTVVNLQRPSATGNPERRADEPDVEGTIVANREFFPAGEDDLDDAIVEAEETFYQVQIGSNSEPIFLDRPCHVGRGPSAQRVAAGIAPRLVRVSSPNKEVSSTHVEVRQLGSSVIVTDLKSTNGSNLLVPGNVPRKLRQGESVVVTPGTLVDIGDDNILQILPRQRLGS